jgi:hypothetical protein
MNKTTRLISSLCELNPELTVSPNLAAQFRRAGVRLP